MVEAEDTAAQPLGESEGRLLSIREISRRLSHPLELTADLVSQGIIPSIDGGRLATAKRYDVEVVREPKLVELEKEWARGSGATLIHDYEPGRHPAVQSALGLMEAIRTKEAPLVAFLSTERTREAEGSEDALMKRWRAAIPRDVWKKGALTTGVYSFPDHPNTVLLRLPDVETDFTFQVTKPTPMNMVAILPLVEEDGVYRADLPLFEQQDMLSPHAGVMKTDAQ